MKDKLKRTDRTVRENAEEALAPLATRSTGSGTRATAEPKDAWRTEFERDRDRIIHCKAIRRLAHKTQVFMVPDDDHFVTRLTHTMQVAQIGRSMATSLGLNEALTEAICLGHDVGHSPFGHTGEDALSPYVEGEWLHSVQSVRILSVLEPLNLRQETLDGIRAHSWKIDPPPVTPEGSLCRFADRIAYLAHDIIDATRAEIITYPDLPFRAQALLGDNHSGWVGTMVRAVVEESLIKGQVVMAPEILDVMHELRAFMFERVYLRPENEQSRQWAIRIIRDLVDYFVDHPEEIPTSYKIDDAPVSMQSTDYVAGMTDRFAVRSHERLYS
ncbi:MAG TPA: HD domain-containing protein [Actinobacteria bacterium]|nr:HD domain-containing protein [Actinomycetota bacterium]